MVSSCHEWSPLSSPTLGRGWRPTTKLSFVNEFAVPSGCHQVFWICRHCDRGQHYCSHPCRLQTRRQQHRLANRRHQQSPEGRQDHRDRQRAYRRRHLRAGVTDVSSQELSCEGRIPLRCAIAVGNPHAKGIGARPRHNGWLRCVLCGRLGRFVEPFPRFFRR